MYFAWNSDTTLEGNINIWKCTAYLLSSETGIFKETQKYKRQHFKTWINKENLYTISQAFSNKKGLYLRTTFPPHQNCTPHKFKLFKPKCAVIVAYISTRFESGLLHVSDHYV